MPPSADEVRAQLERLLASETLASTARLRRFLRHVVERTIAGEGDRLKEYAVGIEVFDRGEEYDPRVDSIVRVEAGRLRAKLDDYYRRAGASDPVVIRIPRGSYVPLFERRHDELPSTARGGRPQRAVSLAGWRLSFTLVPAALLLLFIASSWTGDPPAGETSPPAPRIAVLPFAQYSTDAADALLAARITDGVTSELVRNASLAVVSRTSTFEFSGTGQPLKEVARALNANLVVEASVLTEGDGVRVQARLVDPAVDRKISLHEFDGTRQDLDDLHRRIAAAIAAAARSASSR
ncbi:MAG TPA: hypothetical protein VLD67_13945 [Vicinamibacterales bacterium]|nr:hypothetical protein [Vicinamibacterales bacterium]